MTDGYHKILKYNNDNNIYIYTYITHIIPILIINDMTMYIFNVLCVF